MKIRHKQSGVLLEGPFCKLASSYPNGFSTHDYTPGRVSREWFMSKDRSEYDCHEWEAVPPEPKWVDVTSKFEVQASGWVAGDGMNGAIELFGPGFQDYRLRKVQYWDRVPDTFNQMMVQYPPQYKLVDAIIIEQRQP